MNTPVTPTPPSTLSIQTLSASSGATGTIIQSALPQNAVQLGQTLLGTIINKPAAGQFLMQTDSGELILQTAANLLNGATVSLQIQNGGTRPQVLVFPLSAHDRNTGLPASKSQPTVTSTLTQGSIISATATRQPSTNTKTGSKILDPTSGPVTSIDTTNGPTNNNSTASNGVAGTNAGSTLARDNSSTALTSVSPKSSTRPSSSPPKLLAGMTFNVRILTVTPQGSAGRQVSQTPGIETLTGLVTGTKESGQTVVQTNRGEIKLDSRTALPLGAKLVLELVSTPLGPIESVEETSLLLTHQWEALRNAIIALQAVEPTAAHNLTQQVLPQARGSLTTGILFFLSAMMTGDLRRWMGEDTLRALQRTGNNLVERLSRDIGEMQRLAGEPSGQEWRSYLIPILVGADLQQLKLFVRGEKEQDENNQGDKNLDTRFVIEVEFSNLGPFQFDGLATDKNIDLMIRTRELLADTIRDDIRAIFSNTVSALGLTGTLNFHQTSSFELNPTIEVHEWKAGLTV